MTDIQTNDPTVASPAGLDPDYFYIRLDTVGAVNVIAKAFVQQGRTVKKDLASKTVAVKLEQRAA